MTFTQFEQLIGLLLNLILYGGVIFIGLMVWWFFENPNNYD